MLILHLKISQVELLKCNQSYLEKRKTSHSYFLLNAYNHIKFQKNLMIRLYEVFVFLQFFGGPKMS